MKTINIIDNNLSFGALNKRKNTTRIILHHAEASVCDAATIHKWHKANGWTGIGYHFVVRKNGTIERGRPEWALGAHAAGSNSDSIGICFEGSYMSETMPSSQLDAGIALVQWIKSTYHITRIQRHSEVNNTNCPGRKFPFQQITGPGDTYIPPQSWITLLQTECNVQKYSQQIVDGIYGPNTLKGCPTLREGARGEITRLMQEKLISIGYSCGDYGADGIFGSSTRKAVIAFQHNNKLDVDGVVGPNTWRKLITFS